MKTSTFFPLILLILCPVLSDAQTDDIGWIQKTNADYVRVFSRPQEQPDRLDDVRGVFFAPGSIDSAFKILSNWPRFCSTDPFVVKSEIIQVINEKEFYVWEELKMPFYMNNCDIVSRITLRPTSKGGYILYAKAVPDYIPEKAGHVRIKDRNIIIAMQPIDKNSFECQYTLYYSDAYPPNFVAHIDKTSVESTHERLKQLRKLVEQY